VSANADEDVQNQQSSSAYVALLPCFDVP